MSERASYFPVSRAPLKMVAGLRRHGTDFGQGDRDRQFFQRDSQAAHYLAAKRAISGSRHLLAGNDEGAVVARGAALQWLRETLGREHPDALRAADHDHDARDELEAIARAVQEDLAVLHAGADDAGYLVALDVRFPSGWRPERLGGASFRDVHGGIPGLLTHDDAARSMTRAMVERGPYVRFVWTLSADDQLDHHPDTHARIPWESARTLFLRVERQVTIPLPEARASVFLIRTYHYGQRELTAAQRDDLREALRVMPDDVRRYKNLPSYERAEALLRQGT